MPRKGCPCPLIIGGLALIFKSMPMSYNGNIEIYVPADAMAQAT